MTDESTFNEVRTLVATTLGIEDRASGLHEATQLIGGLPEFDSMAVVHVVTAIESRFGIEFDDDDITGELFETLGGLAEFVDSRRSRV
jgi:acyl carrier protein